MAKPALIELNRSIIQAGGASTQTVLLAAIAGIRDALKNTDWKTRKAASVALGQIASVALSSLRPSCILLTPRLQVLCTKLLSLKARDRTERIRINLKNRRALLRIHVPKQERVERQAHVQATMAFHKGSDCSPPSLNSDTQDCTRRIMFKLFDKHPSHFPRTLRSQIYNWLSTRPSDLESYIMSGCVVLSIYAGGLQLPGHKKDTHVQTMGNMEVSRVDISGLHQNPQTHRP
ncbi:Squamosa promoter-binding-like protein [Trifolium repens]|nr:Squamosa promoter-binding-like protein [Trifolium repens]